MGQGDQMVNRRVEGEGRVLPVWHLLPTQVAPPAVALSDLAKREQGFIGWTLAALKVAAMAFACPL